MLLFVFLGGIFFFIQKTGFDDSCKLFPFSGDNLHNISNPVLSEI